MKNTKKLGLITIGQSPRVDITGDIMRLLGDKIELIEAGALDKYTNEEVRQNFKPQEGDIYLVSRMRDGSQAEIAEGKIHDLMQECVTDLEERGCTVIIIMCTGSIPEFKSKSLVLYPQKLIHNMISNMGIEGKIGVFVPDIAQAKQIGGKWTDRGLDVELAFASPYESIEAIQKEAAKFKSDEFEFVFLDCMGYSDKMKEIISEITNKPVILPRTFITSIATEML